AESALAAGGGRDLAGTGADRDQRLAPRNERHQHTDESGAAVRAPLELLQEAAAVVRVGGVRAGIARAEDPGPPAQRVHHEAGAADSAWIPAVARSIMRSSSAREKGAPSAVACASTSSPAPVITTFMSTSAAESSA